MLSAQECAGDAWVGSGILGYSSNSRLTWSNEENTAFDHPEHIKMGGDRNPASGLGVHPIQEEGSVRVGFQ